MSPDDPLSHLHRISDVLDAIYHAKTLDQWETYVGALEGLDSYAADEYRKTTHHSSWVTHREFHRLGAVVGAAVASCAQALAEAAKRVTKS